MKKHLALVAVLALALTSVAAAAGTKTYKGGGTLYASISKLTGVKATITGFAKDKAFGQVVVIFPTAGAGKGSKTTLTVYSATGSIKGKTVSDNVADKSGKLQISNGKITFSGGTGAYKGAKGTGTFSGVQQANGGPLTLHYKTKITVKK